jgi:hypothetical protein
LVNGENGLMTANLLDDYVTAVSELMLHEPTINLLTNGCKASAKKYTVENMARKFADGVVSCLELPIIRG